MFLPKPKAVPEYAWYATVPETALRMPAGVWVDMNLDMFPTRLEGLFVLTNTTFTAQTEKLFHLSGRCMLKRPPETVFTGQILTGNEIHQLGNTTEDTLVISYTMPAQNLTISLYQDSSLGLNKADCNLLFEKVR